MPGLMIALLVALVLGLAVANVALVVLKPAKATGAGDRAAVLAAARTGVEPVLSYNYKTVPADAARARRYLTGTFATQYQTSIDKVVAVQAPKVRAVVSAQVDSAGLEAVSGDGKQATVVVFAQQKVTNTSITQPRVDLVRLRVTLNLVGSRWLIANLQQLG
ncbi:hypothetical protein M6D93_17180 [Jatrophihabitans telluris]|uniref:Mce-associated membrane protein n=1 Tax=Jatrophihabitans telluris TaxID=2038343 RepID=A0ABY4R3G1_9ACTN|nr:hypothetical protein [Jatrophihabitans telluris]UQX90359.1 hypothetical protein M6D93_17180 [Jatrophihabitans telluris]